MPREIRFRVWDGEQYVSPDYIGRDGRAYWKENSIPTSSAELEQLAGLTGEAITGLNKLTWEQAETVKQKLDKEIEAKG